MTKKTEDRMEDKCNSGVTRYLDKDGNEPTKADGVISYVIKFRTRHYLAVPT